jgi:hypothetical protein
MRQLARECVIATPKLGTEASQIRNVEQVSEWAQNLYLVIDLTWIEVLRP